jgi:hypothetical protein
MEITPYTQNPLLPQTFSLYPDSYSGSVQLLDKAGFDPFQTKSPLRSTLNQIFGQFVAQTGSKETTSQLEGEYLQKIGYGKKVQNLYQNLAETFTAPKPGADPPIVAFINEKISTLADAGATNASATTATADLKQQFYGSYQQLQKLLSFFNADSASGSLVNILA